MAYPKILQRLFEDFGAGPKLRGDILPFGSKEGTACEGDDARLSNARVPETHNETHKTGGTDPLTPTDIGAHPADGMASTDKAGIVRLSSATDMDSEDQASTPKAVKAAYELADTAKSMAAEAQGKADAAYEKATLDATTDVAGRTQLSSEVDSDREDMAATPRAVKSVHDKAIEAASAASAAQALAASAESTATAAKTNADKVPGISTQVKALEEKVQTATPDKLGLVRIGQGISVDETGLISTEPVTLATPDAPGIVQVGAGLEVTLPAEAAEGEEAPTPGILSLGAHASESSGKYGQGAAGIYGHVRVTDNFEEENATAAQGVAISPSGVKIAWDRILLAKQNSIILTSGTWTVPETGTYKVVCVGGGGNGGSGSGSAYGWSSGTLYTATGGGGGGGGAGQVITQTLSLTKDQQIAVTIGGPGGGGTSFGTYITASGGGNGGAGEQGGGIYSSGDGGAPQLSLRRAAYGGAAGTSYGSPASAGGNGSWTGSKGASGGAGGSGGTSFDPAGEYGHGGSGGGGRAWWSGAWVQTGGTPGNSGIQGCVRISLN